MAWDGPTISPVTMSTDTIMKRLLNRLAVGVMVILDMWLLLSAPFEAREAYKIWLPVLAEQGAPFQPI